MSSEKVPLPSESGEASAPPATPPQTVQNPPYPELSAPSLTQSQPTSAPAPALPTSQPPQQPQQPIGFMEAPPSYQDAVNYPTSAPTAGGSTGNHYQPATNPAYPKYAPVPVPAQYPPAQYPSNYGGYPHGGGMPAPEPIYPANAQPTAAIVVNVAPMGMMCAHCGGQMMKETDVCCLMCIIFLAVFMFPIGLPFLCCIPCTVRRRCMQCQRIG